MFRKSALVALSLSLAGPVAATPGVAGEAHSRVVRIADLNLASPAGIAALDRRIGQAVRQVCGLAPAVDLRSQQETRRCRQATRASVTEDRLALIAAARSTGRGGPEMAR